MDRCRCSEYKAAIDKFKFYIPGTYLPSYMHKYDTSGYAVCWVRHKMQVPFDTFQVARAWYSDPGPDQLSADSRRLEHMWCKEMCKFKGTRHPEPATGLQQLKQKQGNDVPKKSVLGDAECVLTN
ncbi:hypothetical protein O0L34_g3354 [Tuta absoluta]|nr:hypothetical protein O0L34_g3354 [Tuta absoluta]